jgi:hypothetical protein
MDSSIRVFQRAWGWIKLIFGIAVGLLVLAGGGVFWKASDFWSGVDKAKQSVSDSAKRSADEITETSSKSQRDILKSVEDSEVAISAASKDAIRQSDGVRKSAGRARVDFANASASIRADIENSRTQLQAAGKLQPQMEEMRRQLAQATSEIQAQQKALSSSEEFVKNIFSSHRVEIFTLGQSPSDRYAVIPPVGSPTGNTVVLILLGSTPIPGTLQLQYHIYSQPPNSYFNIQNLVVFFWADPADNLRQKSLSVSYFPDTADKDVIHALSQRDGRFFADDQPLPKFNQADPDFKGNKWMPTAPTPAN